MKNIQNIKHSITPLEVSSDYSQSNKMKSCFTFILLSLLALSSLFAQIPSPPNPPRLANDLAGLFSAEQMQQLETQLDDFANKTSNQIAVVVVPELYGMDKAQLAYEIGEQWGVGQKKFNNGLIILVKPKTSESRGEVFIAPGYGLEGVLPDALAKRIVEVDMIPHFKENDYYGGIQAALTKIMPLLAGEISTSEFAKKYEGNNSGASFYFILFLIFFVIILSIIVSKNDSNNIGGKGGSGHRGPSAIDLLLLGSILNGAGRRSSGGGFGGGGFSGGGGFGGFGGGSFGGGGAGGSW